MLSDLKSKVLVEIYESGWTQQYAFWYDFETFQVWSLTLVLVKLNLNWSLTPVYSNKQFCFNFVFELDRGKTIDRIDTEITSCVRGRLRLIFSRFWLTAYT